MLGTGTPLSIEARILQQQWETRMTNPILPTRRLEAKIEAICPTSCLSWDWSLSLSVDQFHGSSFSVSNFKNLIKCLLGF